MNITEHELTRLGFVSTSFDHRKYLNLQILKDDYELTLTVWIEPNGNLFKVYLISEEHEGDKETESERSWEMTHIKTIYQIEALYAVLTGEIL